MRPSCGDRKLAPTIGDRRHLHRGLVQGFLLLELGTLSGTRSQPLELVDTKQMCKVDEELQRPSAFRLGGPARIQENEPRLLPAAAQLESSHRKCVPTALKRLLIEVKVSAVRSTVRRR